MLLLYCLFRFPSRFYPPPFFPSGDTTEAELCRLFSSYGNVKSTKIIVDRAGVSKGYGFVTFETEHEAQKLQNDVSLRCVSWGGDILPHNRSYPKRCKAVCCVSLLLSFLFPISRLITLLFLICVFSPPSRPVWLHCAAGPQAKHCAGHQEADPVRHERCRVLCCHPANASHQQYTDRAVRHSLPARCANHVSSHVAVSTVLPVLQCANGECATRARGANALSPLPQAGGCVSRGQESILPAVPCQMHFGWSILCFSFLVFSFSPTGPQCFPPTERSHHLASKLSR